MAQPPKPAPTPPRPPATPPRPAATHAPARPPLHEPEAKHPEPPKAEHKPAAKPEPEPKVDVSALTLSFTVHTSIGRLDAGRAEVAAWTHNLEHGLQADLDAGALTEAEARAVAEKYEVKAPKPTPAPAPAEETKPAA